MSDPKKLEETVQAVRRVVDAADHEIRIPALEKVLGALKPIPPAVSSDLIFKLYDLVREYDVHYSTVRSAISTFLVAAVFGIDAWIVNITQSGELTAIRSRVVVSCLFGPLVLLVITLLISAHFQRLTICCQKIQENLEAQLVKLHQAEPLTDFWTPDSAVLFRRGIDQLIKKNQKKIVLDPILADIPQRSIFLFTIAQILAAGLYWWPVLRVWLS